MVVGEAEPTLGIGALQVCRRSQRTTQDLTYCSLQEDRFLIYKEGQWRQEQ